jgi:hypothetical protein
MDYSVGIISTKIIFQNLTFFWEFSIRNILEENFLMLFLSKGLLLFLLKGKFKSIKLFVIKIFSQKIEYLLFCTCSL